MIPQQEHIHSLPSDAPPASPYGMARKDADAPIDDSSQTGAVRNEAQVTIICSCGKRISVADREIRTAMTSILGFSGLLADELSNPDHAYAAEAIRSNGEYLLQMLCGIRVQSATGT